MCVIKLNCRSFSADFSANIHGIQRAYGNSNKNFHASEFAAENTPNDFPHPRQYYCFSVMSEGSRLFWSPFLFRPWGMQTWEITNKSKEKQEPDLLLPAASRGWSGYNHLAVCNHCPHGHCLIPHCLISWLTCTAALYYCDKLCEVASVLVLHNKWGWLRKHGSSFTVQVNLQIISVPKETMLPTECMRNKIKGELMSYCKLESKRGSPSPEMCLHLVQPSQKAHWCSQLICDTGKASEISAWRCLEQ